MNLLLNGKGFIFFKHLIDVLRDIKDHHIMILVGGLFLNQHF